MKFQGRAYSVMLTIHRLVQPEKIYLVDNILSACKCTCNKNMGDLGLFAFKGGGGGGKEIKTE